MEEKTRMVTLHKHETEVDGIVWQIKLDGVNTSSGVSQEILDAISPSQRNEMIDEIVNGITDSLMINSYPISDKEKNNLNKLLQCMT